MNYLFFYFDDLDYLDFKALSFTLAMTNTQNPHVCLLMMGESPCCSSNMMHQEKANGKLDKGINPKRRSLLPKKNPKQFVGRWWLCASIETDRFITAKWLSAEKQHSIYSMLLRYGVQNILFAPVNTPDLDVFLNILYRWRSSLQSDQLIVSRLCCFSAESHLAELQPQVCEGTRCVWTEKQVSFSHCSEVLQQLPVWRPCFAFTHRSDLFYTIEWSLY